MTREPESFLDSDGTKRFGWGRMYHRCASIISDFTIRLAIGWDDIDDRTIVFDTSELRSFVLPQVIFFVLVEIGEKV